MSRALALVVLALCAAGCLKSESSPMGPSGTASFQGTWTGQWARTACSETGGGGTSCAGLPQTGFLEARLTQSGTAVTGQLEIETFIVSVTGQVGGDGALTLSGQGRFVTVTVTLASWRTTSDGSALTGSFTFVITPDDPGFGVTTAQASLQNVTKTG
jgi:hypothetical protein